MHVVFDHSEDIVDHIKTFWFKPEKSVNYTAGQYTELKLQHKDPDDRGVKRWFTLSSSPSEKLLSITTRSSVPGSTFKQTLFQLKPGIKLHLAEPMGDFVLPKDTAIPLVFVAGGMGITPMRSMIKWLSDTGEKRAVKLLYVTQSPSQLAFLPLFKNYCQQVITLAREENGEEANLTAEKILAITKPENTARIYLSGPEPMMEDLMDQFKALRFDTDRLVTDYFPGYKPI